MLFSCVYGREKRERESRMCYSFAEKRNGREREAGTKCVKTELQCNAGEGRGKKKKKRLNKEEKVIDETRGSCSTVALGVCPPQGIRYTIQHNSAALLDKELGVSK